MKIMWDIFEQHLLQPPPGGGRKHLAAVIVHVGCGDGGFGERVPDAHERDPFEAGDRPATRHSVSMSLFFLLVGNFLCCTT